MSATEMQAAGTRPADTYVFMGNIVTVRVRGDATDGAYAVIEHEVPPQAGPPPHIHKHGEVLTVLEGEFELLLDERTIRAGAGETVVVPAGTMHTSRNVGEAPGRLVSTYAPAGGWRFFCEAGTPLADSERPDLSKPVDLSTVDLDAILELAAKHDMTVRRA